jgi:proliferating cell nuclear antigen
MLWRDWVVKFVFPNASKFKNLTQVLSKVVDEAPLFFREDGLYSKSLSEDKTTMVVVTVPSVSFESIEIEEPVALKVNSREFHRILRRGTRNDFLELIVDSSSKVLRIIFRDKKTDVIRAFELPAVFEGIEDIGEPKVELPVKMEMVASDFKDIIADAKIVGEELLFSYSNDRVVVKAEGMGREYTCELKTGEPLISLSSQVDDAEAKYSVDLLSATMKAASAGSTVSISFGRDLPMKVYFEIPEIGSLVYWVAPRM